MGPGARQVPQTEGAGTGPVSQRDRSRNSRLADVMAIRSSYSVTPNPTNVTINYTLNNRRRTFTLEYSALPISDITAQALFGGKRRAATTGTFLIDSIRGVENVTGTSLTQQQAEGIAKYACKKMIWGYMGIGSAVGAAAFFWRRGRDNMKFPIMKPKDPARYQNFPNRYIPILKGNYARIMWQITRFNVYVMLGIFALSPIFNSIGDTSMTVGLYRDDRTRPVLEKLRKTKEARGLQRIDGNLPSAAGESADPSGAEEDASMDSFSGDGYDGGAGADYSDGMDSTGDVPESTQTNATQVSSRASQQRRSPWGQPAAQQPPQPESVSPATSQEPDPFDLGEDLASASASDPNSPQYNPAAAQTQKRPQRSWASIRNDARQGRASAPEASSPGTSTGPRPGASNANANAPGEQFSYGAEEAGKQLAKEQAQKEFDAMLERERQLGEQGNEGSRGSAWGRRRGGG